ncbi:hypothetical protein K0M31_002800 [Melipona bicolor]|uniref:Lethal(2) giant larvae protein homolog 1 n=1 Tax=Melipona bicolor TaxID=60889 RepID=A0AA40FZW6_9HYME|nr:hypothetical protein K0M31_002800 [Melipona bicolor]
MGSEFATDDHWHGIRRYQGVSFLLLPLLFGRPGVEFYGQHTIESGENAVTKIIALPNEGRVVSLCDDNSLHLWEINESSVVETKTLSLEGKLKKISAMCLESSGEHLLLGTEGGNIYLLNLKTFMMPDNIIYQDVVMQNVPDDYKKNPGAVEAIAEQPGHPDNILIGYNRGLMVLWNKATPGAQQTFVSTQQLESVHWVSETRFVSSHNDGSYAFWSPGSDSMLESTTPYGPFPCKAVTKILVYSTAELGELILFSGGMQRASYGDRHTITVMAKGKHVVFDFTSKVIDFFTVFPKQQDGKDPPDSPEALIVLAEEEIVAIDLTDPDWKMMALPYLVSLHASAVTCSQHVSNVPEELWDIIIAAGKAQTEHLYSDKPWPIDGGIILNQKSENNKSKELLLTGHEDGTVRFWNATDVVLTLLYKFNTSVLFTGEHLDVLEQPPEDDENEWPPFRKLGTFDPFSDDPRLGVNKVLFCPLSSKLIVAGTAGHVIIASLSAKPKTKQIKPITINIVNDRDGFVWKGHDHLPARTTDISFAVGFQPQNLIQLYPPAAVTALAIYGEWELVAVGTAHGLAVFDYMRVKPVTVKCTLNPNDLSGAGDTPICRRKSFKKSLRESFRRLRRSQRRTNVTSPTRNTASEKKKETSSIASSPSGDLSPVELKPVERQVEARPVDDALGSMVRCLYFAKSYIISMQNTTPTLWAGTNNGTVYVFTLAIPAEGKRLDEDVNCTLGKEIHLKHRAPVIGITILDGSNVPLPEPFEVMQGLSLGPNVISPHKVVIASEEQFKIFNLPSLKPYCKYKLTAHEGSRVRKTGFAKFTCSMEPAGTHEETCLLCLTNLGDCLVLSIPELRRQLNAAAIKKEDINGISSLTFTKVGEALYLHSSSELQRISLSANRVTKAHCALNLPPNARSFPEVNNEETQKQDVIESTAIETENEATQESQSTPIQRIITENGVIGSSTTVEREIRSGTETTTTHATITLPPNVEISTADLANLEITTTTVTTEKSKAPLARPEEIGS